MQKWKKRILFALALLGAFIAGTAAPLLVFYEDLKPGRFERPSYISPMSEESKPSR